MLLTDFSFSTEYSQSGSFVNLVGAYLLIIIILSIMTVMKILCDNCYCYTTTLNYDDFDDENKRVRGKH